jgi:hypothetical protein
MTYRKWILILSKKGEKTSFNTTFSSKIRPQMSIYKQRKTKKGGEDRKTLKKRRNWEVERRFSLLNEDQILVGNRR